MRVSISLMKQLFVYWCLYTLELARYRQVFHVMVDTGFLRNTTDLSIESCRIHFHFMLSVGPCGRIQKDNCRSWNMRWLHLLIHFHSHIVPGRWYLIIIFFFSCFLNCSMPKCLHITLSTFSRLIQMWLMLPKVIMPGTASTLSRCCASLLNLAMQIQCGQCLITLWVIALKYCFLVLATSMYVFCVSTLSSIMYICWLTWT